MKYSFVIIAYNEEETIGATIDSILAQDKLGKDYQIIVVNDGSTDGTAGVVSVKRAHNARIELHNQTNQGRGAARAAGVKAASGDYIAFVDADILLPRDWLCNCVKYMSEYDVCGGIAVPDGDVTYIHRIFRLRAKIVPHTTTATGSNSLFRKRVFETVHFNASQRNGEDVDLGYQLNKSLIKTTMAHEIIVQHNEIKPLVKTALWLYESGIGASRQFYEHKELRLADIAFFGYLGIIAASMISSMLLINWWPLILPGLYILSSASLHTYQKFYITGKCNYMIRLPFAILTDACLLGAYYTGRFMWWINFFRRTSS